MSKLLLNVNKLLNPTDDLIQLYNINSIKYRIVVQFLDIITLDDDSIEILVQNLHDFDDLYIQEITEQNFPKGIAMHLKIDSTLYEHYFINAKSKLNIQPGEVLSINIICWKSESERTVDSGEMKWHVVNMSKLNLVEVEDLRNFLLTPLGKQFIEL